MTYEINIDDKILTLLQHRRLINNRSFNKGEISMSEYNIDNITVLSNQNDFYHPKRIFSDLLPFLVCIVQNDLVINSVYCFGLKQHDPYENTHDIQTIGKDIEIEIKFQTPISVIEELILNCINNMDDNHFLIDTDIKKGVTLTVAKIELLKETRENKINNIKTYEDDSCIICAELKPNVLFCNCGHLVLCEECYGKLSGNKCPKCRQFNEMIRKI